MSDNAREQADTTGNIAKIMTGKQFCYRNLIADNGWLVANNPVVVAQFCYRNLIADKRTSNGVRP